MCLYDRKSPAIVYISAVIPVSMNVCGSARSGGPTHLPAFPTEQDWTSVAEWGWEGRIRLTSHLNQGCIELEMDEVGDETRVGITCIFQLVHSHPPNPPHASGIFPLPKDAVLLSKET